MNEQAPKNDRALMVACSDGDLSELDKVAALTPFPLKRGQLGRVMIRCMTHRILSGTEKMEVLFQNFANGPKRVERRP